MEQFFCKTKLITGTHIFGALAQMHISRLFLVCDPFFRENGTAQALLDAAACAHTFVFSEVKADPDVRTAAKGAAALRAFAPDTVVALGGGSTMDAAKAMLYFSGQSVRLIAVPTTSGSGSEVTDFAVLTHEGVKHPLVDERLRPDIALLDGSVLTALPPSLVADGGFDLVSHALEAWAATNASALSDMYATEALRRAFADLPASFRADATVRLRIHEAATMAGIAFSNAGLGLCHALSHSLGGEFHIPHGRLNAILLPVVMEHNATVGCHRYALLARSLGLSGASDALAYRALKNALLRLRRNLRLPQTLAEVGISPPQVRQKAEQLVSAALEDPCCMTNPLPPTRASVTQILTEVTGGE